MAEPRIFASFNPAGPPCPVCGTRADRQTILVPIPGTERDGICEARQVHRACYDHVIEMHEAVEEDREREEARNG